MNNTLLKSLPEAVADCLVDLVSDEMRPNCKCDPFRADNFGEAMAEASDEQMAQLAANLRAGDSVAVTAALHLIVRKYWFDYACSLLAETAYEIVEQADDYNPAELQAWERDLPIHLQYQAH